MFQEWVIRAVKSNQRSALIIRGFRGLNEHKPTPHDVQKNGSNGIDLEAAQPRLHAIKKNVKIQLSQPS